MITVCHCGCHVPHLFQGHVHPQANLHRLWNLRQRVGPQGSQRLRQLQLLTLSSLAIQQVDSRLVSIAEGREERMRVE